MGCPFFGALEVGGLRPTLCLKFTPRKTGAGKNADFAEQTAVFSRRGVLSTSFCKNEVGTHSGTKQKGATMRSLWFYPSRRLGIDAHRLAIPSLRSLH